MKKIFVISSIIALGYASMTYAASSPLNEHNWSMPNTESTPAPKSGRLRNNIDEFGNPMTPNNNASSSCAQACIGYSSTISDCPEGYVLTTCQAPGCYNFNKCEPSPCAPEYDSRLKDCPIDVQPDNYLCTKCK